MKTYDHHSLFTSANRNNWFYNQLKKACPNKICMDIGVGSGILSLFAIQAGAKHVYMVDHYLNCIEMARDIFEYNNIPKEKYTIIYDNFDNNLAKTLPDIDVIVSETIASNLFNQDFFNICKIIQGSKTLKNAIMIPDKIYGSLTFFENVNSIDSIEQLFKKRDTVEKLYTGIKHIDNEYIVLSNMINRISYHDKKLHQYLDNHMGCRPWIKPHSEYESIMLNVWQDAMSSACYTTDDVIIYDAYNPLTTLEWQTEINIPNNIYGIRLNGFLECERTNSARLDMSIDVWATCFYKLNKTNNNLKIQFKTGDPDGFEASDFIFINE